MPKRKLEQNKDKVTQSINDGLTADEIANIYGCSKSGVACFAKKYKLELTKDTNYLSNSPEICQCIIEDYLNTKDPDLVANTYNTSRSTIIRILRDNNIKLVHSRKEHTPFNKVSKEIIDKIRELYVNTKLQVIEIADQLNISTTTVHCYVKDIKFRTLEKGKDRITSGYYIYAHFDANGNCFYIGKGTGKRAWSYGRNKKWEEIASNGYSVEIIKDGLDNISALKLEKEIIASLENLTNSKTASSFIKEVDLSLSDFVYYDESSPTCLRWKVDIKSGNGKKQAIKDGIAGHLHAPTNYYNITINKTNYKVHRVVCVLFGLDITDKVVDHLDGDRLNNKISNLKPKTHRENSFNRPKLSTANSSGITGVSIDHKNFRITAYYPSLDGKWISKGFCFKLTRTYEEALTLAIEFRDNGMNELKQRFEVIER